MRKITKQFQRFGASISGTSAIEFALVLPFLAAVVVALPDVGQAASGVVGMESAVRATIQYAMGGGSDMSEAQSLGLQAWTGAPNNAQLTATEVCLCNGGGGTCGQNCSDGSAPQTTITVVASGHVGGSTIGFDKTISRTVRIL